jgi:PBP1b-binding outer membrane lipoprotein LpoB
MIAMNGIVQQLTGIMIVFSMFILSGCAAKVAPVESIANAEMAVKVAQERNASTFAPLELKIAEDKLNGARTALQKEEFDKAQWLSEEALMDARLAEAKALSEKAKKLAQDMRNSIETLRHEIERTQKMKQ